MEVNAIKLEIRKHHVTPGLNVLDLTIDANGEKIVKQTQHKDTDMALQENSSRISSRCPRNWRTPRIE